MGYLNTSFRGSEKLDLSRLFLGSLNLPRSR